MNPADSINYQDFKSLIIFVKKLLFEALKNRKVSINVSYTRKSLVKGERFIRALSKRLEMLILSNSKEILQNEKLTLSLLKVFNFG